MLETKQLQYFVVSADCGSFREAAKILYTTQSNVSKVIAGLESQVGYPLFFCQLYTGYSSAIRIM